MIFFLKNTSILQKPYSQYMDTYRNGEWKEICSRTETLTEKTGQVRVPKGALARSYSMSHGFVVYVERQILLVIGGIQWPIGRRPATVAKSVGVPIIQSKICTNV